MFNVKETGKRMKDVRDNMKQEECANSLGISRAALSSYENGSRTMDIEILYKFCCLFNVSADYILGNADDPTTSPDMKAAIKYTNLSEKALIALRNHLMEADDRIDKDTSERMNKRITEPLSKLLLSIDFYELVIQLGRLQSIRKQMNDTQTEKIINLEKEYRALRGDVFESINKLYFLFDRRNNDG